MKRFTPTLLIAFILAGVAPLTQAVAASPSLAGVPDAAGEPFEQVWMRTDLPVAEGVADRTWMWGPEPFTDILTEPYAESPGESRQVIYYDKSRMELTNPDADPSSPWYVTNGLLAVELTTGRMQVGHNQFEQRLPSELNVAGDQGFENGPSYATFGEVVGPYQDCCGDRTGEVIQAKLDRSGQTSSDSALQKYDIENAYFDDVTGSNIAAPFWEFMHSTGQVWEAGVYINAPLFPNPFYATGRPVSGAYWTRVVVGGIERDVLIQCFERRCLTYTPGNPEGWRVETGNIGRHYHAWRYAERPQVDGQILFTKFEQDDVFGGPTSELYLADATGELMMNLTGDVHGYVDASVWSPDGSRIAFVATGNIGVPGELYVVNADGTGLILLASDVVGAADWSPDGSQLAFIREVSPGGPDNLFVVAANGTGFTQITSHALEDSDPRWSPDGLLIAFERQLSEDESQIFLIEPDGENEWQLTDIPIPQEALYDRVSFSRTPLWSPDGRWIAFTSLTGSTVPPPSVIDVMVIEVDGTDLTTLASTVGVRDLVWSPDSGHIAFDEPQYAGRDLDGSAVWIVDLTAGEATVFGSDYTNPAGPAWSPDGALVAMRGRIATPGGETVRWIRALGQDSVWSPAGRFIATWNFNAGLAVVAADGSSQWLLSDEGWNPRWRPSTSP